ncbi:hypothetical protein CTAYLR_005572 [Chrysophaeum taylorii]|uniref:BSD domain-containing protein n=1 Tax=Chrysophaeum taylorii TaxID=2483200 RepID=A0AAD7XJ53_9STRA|nr:hypothetical protein CTAYLR_005572 [Chrysophaeum taylorii]
MLPFLSKVTDGLDPGTKRRIADLGGAVSNIAAVVQEKIECAQERIDSSLDSIKKEHERFVAECEAEERDDCIEVCDDDRVLYDGQLGALPWDAPDEATSRELKSKVLELSRHEDTFRVAPDVDYAFCVKKRKRVVLDLLRIDPNLKAMHSKLSARLKEDVFWTRYFYRCAKLRQECLGRRCCRPPADDDDDDDDLVVDDPFAASLAEAAVQEAEEESPVAPPPVPAAPETPKRTTSDFDLESWLDDDDFEATTLQLAEDGKDYDHVSDAP